ncbi:MAG TPA: glycosyl hydrolase-related protein [Thermoproteota archaeon]|nr:glycosyl hydrolase-related protein [Thermoproteota archaeon]
MSEANETSEKGMTAIVIPHTHWDREWYLPYQEFKIRLVKVIDKLLAFCGMNWPVKSFMLDGQVSIVEDYLEMRPENRELLGRLIGEGRVKVGPWYTQPDESLCTPESIVRNLLIGKKIAKRNGWHTMKVGYLPDTFSHVSTMPSILRGFGIDAFVFTRGLGEEADSLPEEFIWEAPDGSKVLACHLLNGYCNAAGLGVDPRGYTASYDETPDHWGSVYLSMYLSEPSIDLEGAVENVNRLLTAARERSAAHVIPLMNGCDHMPPQFSVPQVVDHLRTSIRDVNFWLGSLEDYVEAVKLRLTNPKLYKGEMRGCKRIQMLWGVTSARMYLKQLNLNTSAMMEKYLEPISTLAWLYGARYPEYEIESAWKLMLQNQAHDSICGTGVDVMHRENEVKFLQARQIASDLSYFTLRELSGRMGMKDAGSFEGLVAVYNPNLVDETIPTIFRASLPGGEWELVDHEEKVFPIQRLGESAGMGFVTDLEEFGALLTIPPMAVSELGIRRAAKPTKHVAHGDDWVENDFFRVELDAKRGGTMKIIQRSGQPDLVGLNAIADDGDAGDTYNYSPPRARDIRITSAESKASVHIESGPVVAVVKVRSVMKVPAAMDGDSRSSHVIDMPIETTIMIWKSLPRIDVRTTIDNVAKDHRVRAVFPLSFRAGSSIADGHFAAVERPAKRPKGEGWVESPPQTHPSVAWVDVSDGKTGLMVGHRGLPEYELSEDGSTLYLTLFRSIGWLSRADTIVRPGHAGPAVPTPDAQMLGTHTFEYSIVPHEGDWRRAYESVVSFLYPPFAIQVERSSASPQPVLSLAHVHGRRIVCTTVKKAEDSDSVVLRLVDYFGEGGEAEVHFGMPLESVQRSDLAEESIGPIQVSGPSFSVKLAPHEILTLLVAPSRGTAP